MKPLEKLISKIEAVFSRVQTCDAQLQKYGALQAQIKAESDAAAQSLDVTDAAAVDAETRRQTQLANLPRAIESVRANRRQAIEDVQPLLDDLKAELLRLAEQEAQRVRAEIEKLLLPYCPPFDSRMRGVQRPARAFADKAGIVAVIAGNATPATKIETNSGDAAFESSVIEHGRELIGKAEFYLNNRESFVPPGFSNKKVVVRDGRETVV